VRQFAGHNGNDAEYWIFKSGFDAIDARQSGQLSESGNLSVGQPLPAGHFDKCVTFKVGTGGEF